MRISDHIKDKIGATIWFSALAIFVALGTVPFFTPIYFYYKGVFHSFWWFVPIYLVLIFCMLWVYEIMQILLENFEDWLREKLKI